MRLEFEAIGTTWQIDIASEYNDAVQIERKILRRIDEFDKAYSRFRDDSIIAKLFKKGGSVILPDDAQLMISFYQDLYEATNGLFTPLIGGALEEAGYGRGYKFVAGNVHSPPRLEQIMEYSHPKITLKQGGILDFGAAGKGYLVDIIGELLECEKIRKYTIDAGGDILHHGRGIKIGMESPFNSKFAIGVIELRHGSVASSSGNKREWGKYHHILNPKTRKSSRRILASWVLAETAMIADGIATSLFFIQPEPLEEKFQFEYFILNKDMSYSKSSGFNAEIFTVKQLHTV